MQVIGLCGYAGSGKDTAAQALVDIGWQRVSFADPIREIALAIDPIVYVGQGWLSKWTSWYVKVLPNWIRRRIWVEPFVLHLRAFVCYHGWDEAKKHREVRNLLQRIGTEVGREMIDENIWVCMASNKIKEAAIECRIPGIVITDLRFPNELEELRVWARSKLVRISRPGIGPVNDHQSDRLLESFEVDHELVNDGDVAKLHAAILAVAKGGE